MAKLIQNQSREIEIRKDQITKLLAKYKKMEIINSDINIVNGNENSILSKPKKKYLPKLCIHGKRKYYCRECGGKYYCIHGKGKRICRQCGGNDRCIHDREKYTCKECGGSSFCNHGRIKSKCIECGGGSICEHDRVRFSCINCDGSRTQKIYCYDCNCEFRKDSLLIHLKSIKHLHNTLPVNL